MPTLVLPDKTIQRVANKEALRIWADSRGIKWKLRENLSQLLGFDPAPTQGSTAGRTREGHYLLQDTTWMYHADRQTALPLFGSFPIKFDQLKKAATVGFGVSTFKRMCSDRRQSDDGWWVGDEPAAVAALPDGSSLLDITLPTTPATLPATQLPAVSLPVYGFESAFGQQCAVSSSGSTLSQQVRLGGFEAFASRSTRWK